MKTNIHLEHVFFIFFCCLFAGFSFGQSASFLSTSVTLSISGIQTEYDLLGATANPDFNGANLGTFTQGSSGILFKGAKNVVSKCNGCNVTGTNFYYRVYLTGSPSGSYTNNNIGWSANSADNCTGGQTWSTVSFSTNLTGSLAAGSYTMEVYSTQNTSCSGVLSANNGGANYKATFTISASTGTGTAGFDSTFLTLSLNGGANTTYDLQAATSSTDFNGTNLGTFTQGSTGIVLKGAEHNVWKCNGCNITGTTLYYRVYLTGATPGSFVSTGIGWTSETANSCSSDGKNQKWSTTSLSTNLTSSLSVGSYTLEVYSAAATSCSGTINANNGGANYKATFTIGGTGTAGFNSTYLTLSLSGGANATYDLQASTANTDFNGTNLGTFAQGSSGIMLKGAEHNVWKCNGCDINGTTLYYRVYLTGATPGSFSSTSIGWASEVTNGCSGKDQRWGTTSLSTNLTGSLAVGNYTLEVYSAQTTSCSGTLYANNGGGNYKATFTISESATSTNVGFNSTYLVLSTNGGDNTYYDLQAETGNIDFNGTDLGIICQGSAGIVLKGAEHNVWKCNSCNITGTTLYYRVYPTGQTTGSFTSTSIGFTSQTANGCGGQDQKWSTTGLSNHLTASLSPGNYTLEVYSSEATSCAGTQYANNGGANFKATFTVNPNVTYYADADGDGFGNPAVTTVSCMGAPGGYVADNTDCNDADATKHQTFPFYVDADGDTYGTGSLVQVCAVNATTAPAGYAVNNTDCDDNDNTKHQTFTFYVDADGDGFGTGTAVQVCAVNATTAPAGYAVNNTDCDDNNSAVHQTYPFYADNDSDTFGAGAVNNLCVASASPAPTGFSINNADCDDTKAAVRPGATEIGYNVIDDDCDGLIDEGFPPKITIVNGTQCGLTLAAIDTPIVANIVAGATGYRWRITTLTGPNAGQIQTLDTALRTMKLTQLLSYAFNTQYKVEVAVYFAGFLQPYNASFCSVITPEASTSLTNCAQTLTAMSNAVYANIVPYATGYRFRITDPINPINTQVLERSVRDFRMTQITDFVVQFGKTYNVAVSVRNTDGSWMSYSADCQVTTPVFPTTSVQDSQCDGYLVPSNSTPIYAISYPGAISYVFQLSGGGLPAPIEVTKSARTFTLNDFAGQLMPGMTYNVKVRLIFNIADPAGPYGKTCSITTPGGARVAVGRPLFDAVAYPNPFTDGFQIELQSGSALDVTVKVYDMTGRLLEDRTTKSGAGIETGQQLPSGVYNVVVTQGDDLKTLRVVKR